MYDYQCLIFHDVDLIPEDDRNLYTCPDQPRHMSVAVSTMNYRLPYKDIFGGVSALTVSQFEKVNGFSNQYWGWGAEDDDMSSRVRYNGLKITRYSPDIARYFMLKHKKDSPNPDRWVMQPINQYHFFSSLSSSSFSDTKNCTHRVNEWRKMVWIHYHTKLSPSIKKNCSLVYS